MKGKVMVYWCDLCGTSRQAQYNSEGRDPQMPKGWKQIGKEHICELCVKQFEAHQRIKVTKA